MDDQRFITSYMLNDEILVIRLQGKLDGQTVDEFHKEIERQHNAGVKKMIIDCARLGYVSSYGIGALVRAQAKFRHQGGEIKLASVQSVVANVFQIVHLDKLLDFYGDIEFARESFYE